MALVTRVQFLGEKLKATIPLHRGGMPSSKFVTIWIKRRGGNQQKQEKDSAFFLSAISRSFGNAPCFQPIFALRTCLHVSSECLSANLEGG